MKVKHEASGLIMPMVSNKGTRLSNMRTVWVTGVNKSMLKEYNIKMFDCRMVHLSMWIYLVDRADFEGFLTANNLPMLTYTL